MAIKKTVKTLSALLLAGLLLEGGGYLYGLQPSDIIYHYTRFKKDKDKIEKEYSLTFKHYIEKTEYPAYWEDSGNKENSASGLKNKIVFARFFSTLRNEIKKYPRLVIHQEINTIFSLKSLIIGGLSVGGTYDPAGKSIFIKIKKKNKKNSSKTFIKRAFHHEFSSILMHNYKFKAEKWRANFSEDFLYKSEEDPFYYIIEMQGNAEKISDEALHARGLLKQYAETGVENDFNTYAEVIFTEPRKMKKLIAEYPVIKRKYTVFKEFYLSIDSGFSPVFEKIDG